MHLVASLFFKPVAMLIVVSGSLWRTLRRGAFVMGPLWRVVITDPVETGGRNPLNFSFRKICCRG